MGERPVSTNIFPRRIPRWDSIFSILVGLGVWPFGTASELYLSLENGEETAPLITNSCFNLGILVLVDIFLAVHSGPSAYTVVQRVLVSESRSYGG